ncbi:MAG TPA: ATP-binding protein, partial [Casimicrobiaceae bacterium]|nr:ATP-binding protein [Casimicrobiaceae bacterium]
MLQRDAELTMEQVQAIARIEKASDLFRSGTWNHEDRNLREFFTYIGSLHDVLRANIYSADGTVIWSTDRTLVGKKYDFNPELERALHGELQIESGTVSNEERPKPEHVNLGKPGERFVENYIPVFDTEGNRQIGVVELYRVPRALFDALQRGVQLIWVSALAGGAFLFLVLLTIMKRAERTMHEQQRRLVESETLAAVGQLAGAVAHSLRNPLSSIRSSAELTLDQPHGDIRETWQDIISEVDRLEGMVRQLLFYSQAPTADIDTIPLAPVIDDVLRGFARDFERRNVRVSADIAQSLPPVRAVGPVIAHVLNSLVANALDAMPGGGELRIVAQPASRGRAAVIEVHDTGRGITAAQMRDLFKPFRTNKAKGLGIGLALAQRVVERCGGKLDVESTEGRGTVVTMRLRAGRRA